jgi:lysophospholipase L1-like esterase
MAIQDRAAKAAAAARPRVVFVDTWTRFSGRDGGFAEFVVDPRDNVGKDVRLDDGFHLNVNGAEILALDIAQAVRDDLRARGAAV